LKLRASGKTVAEINGAETDLPWGNWFGLSDYVRIIFLFGQNSERFPGRLSAETEASMKKSL